MQTQGEVEGLHNCREFSQRLECLYQAMQTQEKSFLLLLKNTFPERKRKTPLCMALIKREILTSRKDSSPKSCSRNRLEKDAFQNTDFSHLKCQLKRKKINTPSL